MKKGILLLNLGTPKDPSTPAVRRYLQAFLMDPRVVDIPWLLRLVLVYGVISLFRARKSAKAYQSIWTEKGSPLLVNSQALIEPLSQKLGPDFKVVLGMRYGEPSIQKAIATLKDHKMDHLSILPLFPQYASASTGSALEACLKIIARHASIPSMQVIRDFHAEPGYIDAYASIIEEHVGHPEKSETLSGLESETRNDEEYSDSIPKVQQSEAAPASTPSVIASAATCATKLDLSAAVRPVRRSSQSVGASTKEEERSCKQSSQNIDYILFSYHGLPERHIRRSLCQAACLKPNPAKPCQPGFDPGDCYRGQCYKTTRLIANKLGLSSDRYQVCFQSRLGRTPWIQPYTDEVLIDLYKQGIRKLAIVCPSFVSDCLETLEEVDIRAREQWLALGGESFHFIPCLNAHPMWVKALAMMLS